MAALSQRVRIGIVGTLGAVGAFFMFGGLGTFGGGGPTEPEAAVPKNTFLFASVSYAELRKSPLHDVLFSDKAELVDRRALGITRLADACGFDPLPRFEKLVVAVPEDGEKGELGVAARVTVTRDELGKCTENLAAQRGAKAEPKDVHGFAVIEASGASIGYGHDLLVAGKGGWFETMLATADGKKPSVKEAEAHATVRRDLTSRNGWATPTILVSALLPRALRDRIKNEMSGEADGREAAQNAMAGVLGVSAVGFALRAGTSTTSTELAAELVCDTEDACAGVEKLAGKKRFEWGKELSLRMVGLGPLLDSIDIKRTGTKLVITAGAPADALATTIQRVLRLRAHRSEPTEPPPAPAPKPDERIPAKP